MEWDEAVDYVGNFNFGFFQRHRTFVQRQSVEAGAIHGREGFETIERAFLLEYCRIAFERERRVENAGAAAAKSASISIGYPLPNRWGGCAPSGAYATRRQRNVSPA